MISRFRSLIFGLVLGLSLSPLSAQEPLSPRNANYTIQVQLDPQAKTLEGKEIIHWRNIRGPATDLLWFHLYYNAWRNTESTWLREDVLRKTRPLDKFEETDWGACDITSMELLDDREQVIKELTPRMKFISPDDGNREDRTVIMVALPRRVEPEESVKIRVTWRSEIPRALSRTGFRGDFFLIAQWFPKLGVLQEDGTWNCHQFHATTEFFSDYGVYDVQITVPSGWLVGATGLEVGVTENGDWTATHRYKQADVHDFAWTTSPDLREARDRFESPGLHSVDMRLVYQPEHEDQIERHFYAARAALLYYGKWFGEYPYDQVTLVDPAWGSNTGGMEYPTFFTCGTRYLNPFGRFEPVVVHEAGHQFWYGIVGSNEFEDAWLDEGFNSFSHARVMDVAYPDPYYVQRFFRDFLPLTLRSVVNPARMTTGSQINSYRPNARSDAQATPTHRSLPRPPPDPMTYDKTALWLWTLERRLGWETLQKILSTYFQRWKFRHPRPEDFFAVVREVTGGNAVDHFFDQVHHRSAVFDFGVESVFSEQYHLRGLESAARRDGAPGSEGELFETRVVVRRYQDGVLPVKVLLRFEDGEEMVESWDATKEWTLSRVVRPSRLEYALVDPDREILLDVNYTNNSRRVEARNLLASGKWASKWMVWLQDYLLTLATLF